MRPPADAASNGIVILLLTSGVLFLVASGQGGSRHAMSAHAGAHHAAHGGGAQSAMMPMSFQAGLDTIIWFDWWHPRTPLTYVATLLLLVAMGLAHEALAAYRVTLAAAAAGKGGGGGYGNAVTDPLNSGSSANQRAQFQRRVVSSSLYALNLSTGYLLMLAVMTFNCGGCRGQLPKRAAGSCKCCSGCLAADEPATDDPDG
jgi:hypothetical protein